MYRFCSSWVLLLGLTWSMLVLAQQPSCYLTSTLIYGGQSAIITFIGSTTSNGTSTVVSATSSSQIFTSNSVSAVLASISNAPGIGSLTTFLGTGAEQTIASEQSSELSDVPTGGVATSTTATSVSTGVPPPAMSTTAAPTLSLAPSTSSITFSTSTPFPSANPFYIMVNFRGDAKRRKRATVYYLSFSGDTGTLVSDQSQAALFQLLNGYLLSGGEFVGASLSDGYSAFQKYATPPAESQGWSASLSGIQLENASFCEANYGTFYIVYTDQPFDCVDVSLAPKPDSVPSSTIMSDTTASVSGPSSSPAETTITASGVDFSQSLISVPQTNSLDSTSLVTSDSTRSQTTTTLSATASATTSSIFLSSSAGPTIASSPTVPKASSSSSTTSQAPNTGLSSSISPALIATVQSSTTSAPASSSIASTANAPFPFSSSSSSANAGTSATLAAISKTSSSVASSTIISSLSQVISTTIAITTTTTTGSTATTSTSAMATPVPGIPIRNTGKRGLAYTNVNYTQYWSLAGQNSQVSWAFDFFSAPNASNNAGPTNPALTFVPLLFNDANSLTSIWSANVNKGIANYTTDSILAFNEPDACYGGLSSCMSVNRSVAAYQTFVQPFAGKVQLGAPAVTNLGPPAGLTYLSYFLGNCTGCTVDFIPIHWYASPYNFQYLMDYVRQAYVAGGNRPIWITEFGMDSANYDATQVQKFLMNATTWLDAQPYVHRYAWFGDFQGNLLNTNGTALSSLGVVWNNYTGGYVN